MIVGPRNHHEFDYCARCYVQTSLLSSAISHSCVSVPPLVHTMAQQHLGTMMERAASDVRRAAAAASAPAAMDDVKESKKRNMVDDADGVHQSSHTAPVPPLSVAAASAATPTVSTVAVCQLYPISYGVQP